MKKSNRYLIPIFILVLGMAFFVQKLAKTASEQKAKAKIETREKIDPTKTDFLNEPIEQTKEVAVVKSAETTTRKNLKTENIEKCAPFLNQTQLAGGASILDQALEKIKQHYGITDDRIDLTEYQLRTRANEEIVVQNIPAEEVKNQIRIFKTAADGFPDRIKKFPNYAGTVNERLAGALTLGTLEKTVEKFRTTNADQSSVSYEKSDGKISRVEYSKGRTQLVCEDGQCACQMF